MDDRPRYEVRRAVGAGGQATVYEAWDRDLERAVAMKVLHPRLAVHRQGRLRFYAEARRTAAIRHPSVPAVYEVGATATGEPFFTMEYVAGATLHALLEERRGRGAAGPALDLVPVVAQVASAVAAAHAAGLVHRDVKPANVAVSAAGTAYLLDWGLSKRVRADADPPPCGEESIVRSVVGEVKGTPLYMAPEQARGDVEHTGPQSDVFAVGALLYEVLCLHPPRDASDVRAVLREACERSIVAPSARPGVHGVPSALEAIAMQALRADPSRRQESADEIARLLRRWSECGRGPAAPDGRGAADPGGAARRAAIQRVADLSAAVAELRVSVAPWAPARDKAGLWAAEDRLRDASAVVDQEPGCAASADAPARVEIRAGPRTAVVSLRRLVERDRVLCAGDEVRAVDGDRLDAAVPAGRYLIRAAGANGRGHGLPVRVRAGTDLRVLLDDAAHAPPLEGFVVVPGATYPLGDGPAARRVRVETFWMAREPVLLVEYALWLDALTGARGADPTPHVPSIPGHGPLLRRIAGRYVPVLPRDLPAPADRLPAVGVTQSSARAYAAWRAVATRRDVRLPGEDEWEAAARGADERAHPWGDAFDPTFCSMESSEQGAPSLRAVGAFPADESPFGVRDMAGNVREWCRAPAGVAGALAVARGGAWHSCGACCRASARTVLAPETRSAGIGFRLCIPVRAGGT